MAPFRWFGGKGNLVKFILNYIPFNDDVEIYVEPFAGAANLFWNLEKPYKVEVLNDIDDRIVNIFRVLQNKDTFDDLLHKLLWTPYSRSEFVCALKILECPENYNDIDKAWAFFVTQNQGFGGKASTEGDWGRILSEINRGMASNVNNWRSHLKMLYWWHERLSRVQIDKVDALKAIEYWDSSKTFFYIDPPYVNSTRKQGEYKYELSDDYHEKLVDLLLNVKGKVMLSGYKNKIYDKLENEGWTRFDKTTVSHAAGRTRSSKLQGKGAVHSFAQRVESIWINYNVKSEHTLFSATD